MTNRLRQTVSLTSFDTPQARTAKYPRHGVENPAETPRGEDHSIGGLIADVQKRPRESSPLRPRRSSVASLETGHCGDDGQQSLRRQPSLIRFAGLSPRPNAVFLRINCAIRSNPPACDFGRSTRWISHNAGDPLNGAGQSSSRQ